MVAAALLFFNLNAEKTSSEPIQQMPERKKPEGFLGWVFFFLVFFLTPFINNIRYFKHTANRREWWGTFGRMFLLMIALTFLGIGQAGTNAVLSMMGILLIPIILASIRRMHDIGKRGWWILVPIYGFILCGFVRGND